jgi:FAD/FMN-containing dehydrogenase
VETLGLFPTVETLVGFGLLPAVPQKFWGDVKERFANVSRLMLAFGAKRYLSGWVDFSPDDWKEHFGVRWDELVSLKRTYDPDGILNPGFLPFEAKHGAPAGTP